MLLQPIDCQFVAKAFFFSFPLSEKSDNFSLALVLLAYKISMDKNIEK